MPVGDDAAAAGFALVPDSGDGGLVRLGAKEINRTRDYVAQTKNLILYPWPVNKGGTGATDFLNARENLGFYYGTGDPSDGAAAPIDGTIYFKLIS